MGNGQRRWRHFLLFSATRAVGIWGESDIPRQGDTGVGGARGTLGGSQALFLCEGWRLLVELGTLDSWGSSAYPGLKLTSEAAGATALTRWGAGRRGWDSLSGHRVVQAIHMSYKAPLWRGRQKRRRSLWETVTLGIVAY
jgi:hypothetical protein